MPAKHQGDKCTVGHRYTWRDKKSKLHAIANSKLTISIQERNLRIVMNSPLKVSAQTLQLPKRQNDLHISRVQPPFAPRLSFEAGQRNTGRRLDVLMVGDKHNRAVDVGQTTTF